MINEKEFELTEEEFETNLNDVFAQLSLFAQKPLKPAFVVAGGQSGSGKTLLVSKEYKDLYGNAIIIDQDELRSKFPAEKYKKICDNCSQREEYLILKPYVTRMNTALMEKAKQNGYNIIFETALRSEASQELIINTAKELKKSGYDTKLSVLAVPDVEANISMLTRYCYFLEKYGECRKNTFFISSAQQDLKRNLKNLDNLGLFDEIAIYVRGKDMASLPIQIYSQKEKPEISPLQAYDRGNTISLDETRKTFYEKYERIRAILIQHGENEQLELLEKIGYMFNSEKVVEME